MKSLKSWIVCFVLLCGAAVLMAQAPVWKWAVQAGGTGGDEGRSIAIDSQGNQYVTGEFYGTATFGSRTLTSSGGYDIFVAKLGPNGNWIWAVKAGGNYYDSGYSIAVDGSGNAYVTGMFHDAATFGNHSVIANGYYGIFVAKLSTYGNWLWAVQAGGTSGYIEAQGIAVNAAGNAWVTGYFQSTATFGSRTLTSSGGYDIFVVRLDNSGNWLWAVKAGGTGDDSGYGIGVDGSGNQYVTGYFQGTATFGNHTLTSYGRSDIFAAKLDLSNNWLWAVNVGDTGYDEGYGIAVDGSGNAWVTGYFTGIAIFGSHTLATIGQSDIFAAKLGTDGNWLFAVQAGGTGDDRGKGIAVDGAGNAYVTGYFGGTATYGSHTITSSGNKDIFVARLSPPTLEADFSADVLFGPDPLVVQFSDESTTGGYPIIYWLWDFGDGGTSTQRHPQYTYTTPGVYTVSLTVTDFRGRRSTRVREGYITVIWMYGVELLSPASLDFGTLYLGEQSAWQTIWVKNTGYADLTFSDVHFVGAPLNFQYAETITFEPLPPGESGSLYVRFAPQVAGALSDTLFIVNNSSNQPVIKVALSGFGLQYDGFPPKEPENVVIAMDGNNAVITWDAVTENTHSQPITPDGYLVYYNGSSDAENGLYYFLAATTNLTHTHVQVGESANWMFYRVAAYKYYGRGSFNLAALGLEPGMTEAEVRRRLELFEK